MSNIQNKIKFNDLDIFNKKINNNILKILKKDFDKNEFIFGQSVENLEKVLKKLTGSKFVCTLVQELMPYYYVC